MRATDASKTGVDAVAAILTLVLAGGCLGAASAAEENLAGFDVGISSDGLWLAVAFIAGALAGNWRSALAGGAGVLTVANLAYYTAGGTAPEAGTWFLLGVAGGLCFGAAGRLLRVGPEPARLASILLLAGVLIAEGSAVFGAEREVDHGAELAVGCLLPVLVVRDDTYRAAAVAATAAVVALAATGALEPLVP